MIFLIRSDTLIFIVVAAFVMLAVLFLVLLERRVLALLTVRYGPNRVGFQGILQTVADAVKLLCKEDICPKAADRVLFFVAPLVAFCPVLLVYFFLPFSDTLVPLKSSVGLILFCAISSVAILGAFLGGYASNNKYSLLGAFRAVSQGIAFETPLLLSAFSVAIVAGSFDLSQIAKAQGSGVFSWFFLPCAIGFFVFFISMLAELNRTPFDIPEAESELVCGYTTEYSGMKFAMFFLGEYALLFAMSAFFVTLFLGGYQSPFGTFFASGYFLVAEQLFWLFLKVFSVIFFIILIRATLPRLRTDGLLDLSYRFLIPLSIVNLLVVIFYTYFKGVL